LEICHWDWRKGKTGALLPTRLGPPRGDMI